jgi:hypothetical protein
MTWFSELRRDDGTFDLKSSDSCMYERLASRLLVSDVTVTYRSYLGGVIADEKNPTAKIFSIYLIPD